MNVPLNKGKQFCFFFPTRELTEFLDNLEVFLLLRFLKIYFFKSINSLFFTISF